MHTQNNKCFCCPRQCGADRSKQPGFCGVSNEFKVARVGLHKWEEPCISVENGSGTIFFSGCSLKCVFCQNYEISHGLGGKYIDADRLLFEMNKLEDMGAANINLVNPTHYANQLCTVLEKFKSHSNLPIVYNSSGFENTEILKKLKGLVDIYLPDVKYFSDEYAYRYSNCKNYFSTAVSALCEMYSQIGTTPVFEKNRMLKGVIVRHLVLPGLSYDSVELIGALAAHFEPKNVILSLMSQYFPCHRASDFPEINRKITTLEYNRVVDAAKRLGFVNGYVQSRASAKKLYVPEFDY